MKKKSFLSLCLVFVLAVTIIGIPGNGWAVNAATKKVKKLTVTKTALIEVGKAKQLKLSVKPKSLKSKVKWKSSNKNIVKVNKKGIIKGKKAGNAIVTASIKSGTKRLKAKCKVTVKQRSVKPQIPNVIKVSSITLDKKTLTLDEGENEKITVTVLPSNATNKTMKYTSSDTDVATVSDKGIVTAIAQGTAVITVVSQDGSGKKETVTVTVTKGQHPRAIFTNDAECDDMNSIIHFLLYANEIDIQGIVQTSSSLHWKGDPSSQEESSNGEKFNEPLRWPGTGWTYDLLDAYEEVYPNLKKHDASYPTPDYLRSVTKIGNIDYMDEMEKDTDGSNLIKQALLDDDERTLYLLAGGGTNCIARALKSIEEEYKNTEKWNEIRTKIINKAVIPACMEQDNTYKTYIQEEWPEIKFINIGAQMGPTAYMWKNTLKGEAYLTHSAAWMKKNLLFNHGALMKHYFTWGDGKEMIGEPEEYQFGINEDLLDSTSWWGGAWTGLTYTRYDFLSEGDSAAFYLLLDSGLRTLENDYGNGGYGGRYTLDTTRKNSKGEQVNYYKGLNDYYEDAEKFTASHARWEADIMHEFAVRADWCVADDYSKANHEPSVSVEEGTDITAEAGQTITLHAIASDPDGDYVDVSWFHYFEADTYEEEEDSTTGLFLKGAGSEIVTLNIPEDAKSGQTIHLVVKATDDASMNLTHYQRVIITIK